MELIMLGTGNAMVTRCYNTCFVLSSGEESTKKYSSPEESTKQVL